MNLNAYQEIAKTTAIYPAERGLEYTALGLAGEAGEYANKISKVIRDGADAYDPWTLAGELGDVLWFLSQCAEEIGIPLSMIAQLNLQKLADRKNRNVLKGSGDTR